MLTVFLISLLLSTIIFYPFNPTYVVYWGCIVLIWVILLMNYSIEKNRQMYKNIVLFSYANLVALVAMKYFVHRTLHFDFSNIVLFSVNCGLVAVVAFQCVSSKKRDVSPSEAVIFPKRQHDLVRIENYINKFDIVGINGTWGSGKTFIVNELKKQANIRDEYIFIEIDLLSCNLDEIQVILLNEMEKVLKNHGIIARHSYKLKKILGDKSVFHNVKHLIIGDDVSYSEAIDGFRNEINLLDRSLIVVYEDIDRISDKNIIKKIFSISEKLSSQKIKILYQYDEYNLKLLGFDRGYLEKYIPYVVNLTDIGFFEVLEYTFKEKWIEELPLKQDELHFLKYPIYAEPIIGNILNKHQAYNLHISGTGIRKVKHFLYELTTAMKGNDHYCNKECRKTVIIFYFIKHLYASIYEQLHLEHGLLDTLKFEYNGKKYTILEIIDLYKLNQSDLDKGFSVEDVKKIFDVKKNADHYAVICLFGYNLDIYKMENVRDEFAKVSAASLLDNNANEKKDRLIWHLLCGGKSEYTDVEAAVAKLISDVLDRPRDEQHEVFLKFNNDLYYGEYEKNDNETIFKLGIPQFMSLFQSFRVVNPSPENWIKLIALYFNETMEENITVEFIETFHYCSLNSREIYLEVLKRFNNLNITGNMNDQTCYRYFLKNYLRALSSLGYMNTSVLWRMESGGDGILHKEIVIEMLNGMRQELEELKEQIPVPCVQKDLDIIIEFIMKNICIINAPLSLSKSKAAIKTKISSRWPHQDEIDKLKSLNLSEEKLLREIAVLYQEGKLGAAEIKSLLHG